LSDVRRWLVNLGLYVAVVAALVVVLTADVASFDARSSELDLIGVAAVIIWLGIAGLAVALGYLAATEVLARRVRHTRRLAVALPPVAFLVSQFGHPLELTPESAFGLAAIAAAGGVYGLLVVLPPPNRIA
jgi:hypothetical protein